MTQKAAYNRGKTHIPNTRKRVTGHYVDLDQWKDGKIVKSWSWSNTLELDTQLGIGAGAPRPVPKTAKAPKTAATKPATN